MADGTDHDEFEPESAAAEGTEGAARSADESTPAVNGGTARADGDAESGDAPDAKRRRLVLTTPIAPPPADTVAASLDAARALEPRDFDDEAEWGGFRTIDAEPVTYTGLVRDTVSKLLEIDREAAALAARRRQLLAHAHEQTLSRTYEADGTSTASVDATVALRELASEIGLATRRSDRAVQGDLADAAVMVERLPRVVAALADGVLGERHADACLAGLHHLTDDTLTAEYDEAMARHAPEWVPSRVRREGEALAAGLAAATVRERCAASVAQRRVWMTDEGAGTSALHVLGPTPLIRAAHDRVARMAREQLALELNQTSPARNTTAAPPRTLANVTPGADKHGNVTMAATAAMNADVDTNADACAATDADVAPAPTLGDWIAQACREPAPGNGASATKHHGRADAASDTDTRSGAGTRSDAGTRTDADGGSDADTGTDADADADADTRTDGDAGAAARREAAIDAAAAAATADCGSLQEGASSRTFAQLQSDFLLDMLLCADPAELARAGISIPAQVSITIPALSLAPDPPPRYLRREHGPEPDHDRAVSERHAPPGAGPIPHDHPSSKADARGAWPDGAVRELAIEANASAPPHDLSGPIDLATARRLAGDATELLRLLTDPIAGNVVAVDRRVPTEAMRRFLRAADATCRWAGCHLPATRADLDHAVAWEDGGPTALDNLEHLCRRHHVLKHRPGYHLELTPDRRVRLRTPAGHTVTDHPTLAHLPGVPVQARLGVHFRPSSLDPSPVATAATGITSTVGAANGPGTSDAAPTSDTERAPAVGRASDTDPLPTDPLPTDPDAPPF